MDTILYIVLAHTWLQGLWIADYSGNYWTLRTSSKGPLDKNIHCFFVEGYCHRAAHDMQFIQAQLLALSHLH